MKRLITFVLVLVMALSLAAPAMAFTTEAAPEASGAKPELAIKLVDLSEGYVTVNFNAPPTNRGYVKNEVVCAVVALQVPKGHKFESGVDVLEFSGVNVSLWQDENFYGDGGGLDGGGKGTLKYVSKNLPNGANADFKYADDMAVDNSISYLNLVSLNSHNSAVQTYHFAIFGRVLGENAKMTATLKSTTKLKNAFTTGTNTVSDAAVLSPDDVFFFTKIGDFNVAYFDPSAPKSDGAASDTAAAVATVASYATTAVSPVSATMIKVETDEKLYVVELNKDVSAIPKGYGFAIVTDENDRCQRMYVSKDPGTASWCRVYDGNKQDDAVKADFWGGVYIQFQAETWAGTTGTKTTTLATTSDVGTFMLLLEKVVYGQFGFDIRGLGNVLKPEWWFENETQTVEVAIEPWYAEVTVPPEIEIDIPKTGDAMSAVGFVLIALAGLAVVAVRKVRA